MVDLLNARLGAQIRAAGASDAYHFAKRAVEETQGVYARHNAVDTPALLPDGSVSEISVPGPLRARGDLRPVDAAAVAETEALASGRAALGPADHPVADDPGTSPGEPR